MEPGQSFIVRITPPRAGTFIYHTHWHDEAQLAGGLYGPLLVMEPGDFATVDEELAQLLAAQAAVAIENARLYESSTRWRRSRYQPTKQK